MNVIRRVVRWPLGFLFSMVFFVTLGFGQIQSVRLQIEGLT